MAITLSMCCAFPVIDIFLLALENREGEREWERKCTFNNFFGIDKFSKLILYLRN